jgi:hypothetical protein
VYRIVLQVLWQQVLLFLGLIGRAVFFAGPYMFLKLAPPSSCA